MPAVGRAVLSAVQHARPHQPQGRCLCRQAVLDAGSRLWSVQLASAVGTAFITPCTFDCGCPGCFCCCRHAGTVSGVQASLQSAFEVVSFLAGAVVNQPQQFHWLMTGSCGTVGLAAIVYLTYAGSAAGSRAQRQLLPRSCSSMVAQEQRREHSHDANDTAEPAVCLQ
jgi:hypothetical protein